MDNLRKVFKRLLNETPEKNHEWRNELIHESRFLTAEELARARESRLVDHRHGYDFPMLHTRESIMQALGLDPNFSGVPGAPPGRATGRTTQMLIDAAVALQHGRVCVAGYRTGYTRELNWDLERMCSRVGIDTSNLIRIDGHHDNVATGLANLGYLLSEVQVFYDHYWGRDDIRTQPLSREMFDRFFAQIDSVSSPTTLSTPYEISGIDQKCPTCKYYSGSKHLRCAPFPTGNASKCPHFEVK